MQKYIYAEYAIGGVQNRNIVKDINTFSLNGNRTDCYRSLFLFDEDLNHYIDRTKSVIGYAGRHHSDFLVFDFDGENLGEVKNEVVKFCQDLIYNYEVPSNYLRIAFSGNKGFHIEIPFQCFSLNPQPLENFWKIYKAMAKDLSGGFRFIDTKIYEPKRLFRLVNTINSKSGLYKLPMAFEELVRLSVNDIKELAKSSREVEYFPPAEMTINPSLSELYIKWKDYNFDVPSKKVLNKSVALFEGVFEGERNDKAIRISGLLIDKGLDEQSIMEVLKMWNERNSPPLDEIEIEYLVRSAYERYKKKEINKIEIYNPRRAEGIYRNFAQSIDGSKVTTGFPLIDRKIRGIMRGETCCIIGKTSVGKSALLQNIGLDYAIKSKQPVLFFSLEMPITSVYERTMQIQTGLSGSDIESIYKSNDTEFNTKADLILSSVDSFYTIEKSGLNLESMKDIVRFAENNVYHKKTGLILVDYLGLVSEKGQDIYQQVSKVARGMKDFAKELNVPIIYLSQVTKQFGEYDELELGAARDSGAIDEASDFVLGLWKDKKENYNKEQTEIPLNLGIIKNRRGGTGKVLLNMEKKTLRISQIG